MRRKPNDLGEVIKNETIRAFKNAAVVAEQNGETLDFLTKLITESEQLMLGRRLLIARMLLSGLPQNEIRFRLKVSPNTVWKVNKWLVEQLPDYEAVLKKVEKEAEKKSRKKRKGYQHIDPFTFTALKRKYPVHFLLFNMSDALLKPKKK